MKDYKRLGVGLVAGNSQSGLVRLDAVEYDGGEFNLVPKIYPGGLILVDPNRPAAYGINIVGSAETLKALGNAIIAAGRLLEKSDDSDVDS